MSYSLNSLKGVIYGIIYGTTIVVIKGDTRSLDYSSCKPLGVTSQSGAFGKSYRQNAR